MIAAAVKIQMQLWALDTGQDTWCNYCSCRPDTDNSHQSTNRPPDGQIDQQTRELIESRACDKTKRRIICDGKPYKDFWPLLIMLGFPKKKEQKEKCVLKELYSAWLLNVSYKFQMHAVLSFIFSPIVTSFDLYEVPGNFKWLSVWGKNASLCILQ